MSDTTGSPEPAATYLRLRGLEPSAAKKRRRTLGDEHPYTVHFQRQFDVVIAALQAAADRKDEDG